MLRPPGLEPAATIERPVTATSSQVFDFKPLKTNYFC